MNKKRIYHVKVIIKSNLKIGPTLELLLVLYLHYEIMITKIYEKKKCLGNNKLKKKLILPPNKFW